MSAFRPKQITEYQASHMAELMGGTSEEVTAAALCHLPKMIAADAVIHDAACGTAPATTVVLEQSPPTVTVHATDINPVFVEAVAAMAKEKAWPVTAAVMDVAKMEFPDDKFTHTFFTFSCPLLKAGGAAETYRTLVPGGVCIATSPTYMPHMAALRNAHHAVRGADAPMAPFLSHNYTSETVLDGLLSGGFSRDKITVHDAKTTIVLPDVRRWMQLSWSYLAMPAGGWIPDDEARWEEAVETAAAELEKQRGVEKTGDNAVIVTLDATICIATK